MIVKFLRPSASFEGVRYSFAKILLDKGELMEVKNFDSLASLSAPRAEDYVNYLEAVTHQSKRIVYPQLHVTISAKGRDHSKYELTDIAGKWLEDMGYGKQPYLIIFHKDTANNHVHIVSTRIGRDGKKISDKYEKVKGYQVLHHIIGHYPSVQVQKDIDDALGYGFSSRAQLLMLLELKGYTLRLRHGYYEIFKFGTKLDALPVETVDRHIGDYRLNKERLRQLRAVIHEYRLRYSAQLLPEKHKLAGGGLEKTTGFHADLADILHQRFGLQFLFHAKNGQPPYGYTAIDHRQQTVYKGGTLMPLAELIEPAHNALHTPVDHPAPEAVIPARTYPEPGQGNRGEISGDETVEEPGYDAAYGREPHLAKGYIPLFRLDLADDIDDEQINGRNRSRKRKARSNTR